MLLSNLIFTMMATFSEENETVFSQIFHINQFFTCDISQLCEDGDGDDTYIGENDMYADADDEDKADKREERCQSSRNERKSR